MAELDEFISEVGDDTLRARLAKAFGDIQRQMQFGLVFERHIPEMVRLPTLPVHVGSVVQPRSDTSDARYRVTSVADSVAELKPLNGEEPMTVPVDELVVVKRFGEPIYPALKSVGTVERGGDKPHHAVINAENFHALQLLNYLYEGQVDCIYIDPPYNTGARDWKYNNRYVDDNDRWRHSKWLSFMEKRLLVARQLLRRDNSVLVVTIDDHELNTLGLLLDKVFPGCERQIVSVTISPRGKSRTGRLAQVDEYIIVVFIGGGSVGAGPSTGEDKEVRWRYLRRNDEESARHTRPRQFYPIYVDEQTQRIVKIGAPLQHDQPLDAAPNVEGAVAVFPIRDDGFELNWGLTGPSVQRALDEGYVRVSKSNNPHQPYTIAYLTRPNINKVKDGTYEVTGTREDGSKVVVIPGGKPARATTAWRDARHDAGAYGTKLLRSLLPGRKFPFPKSLYSVEDTLRLFVGDKPDALVLDFFAGSATTAHAVMRLNRQDGGCRRSVLVTNNEVSDKEAASLRSQGHEPGDPAWEELGIFHHVALPRVVAAVTGQTHQGAPVEGRYKSPDDFPLSDGFEENVEFFELGYLDRDSVDLGREFESILPLLWLASGAVGGREVPPRDAKFSMPEDSRYAVMFESDAFREFRNKLEKRPDVTHVYLVTDSEAAFAEWHSQIPGDRSVSMLYSDYLRNFRINTGATL